MIRVGAIVGLGTGVVLTAASAIREWRASRNLELVAGNVLESYIGANIAVENPTFRLKNMRMTIPSAAGIGHSVAYAKLGLNKYLPNGIGG